MLSTNSLDRTNETYLEAILVWLQRRLHWLASGEAMSDDPVMSKAAIDIAYYEATSHLLPALTLYQRFGLSQFEYETLFLCIAVELDPQIAHLCSEIQGNAQRGYPTFALALALFDNPEWSVRSPDRPLLYWRLIEVRQMNAQSFTGSALRADERIVNYVKGVSHLDIRLRHLIVPLQPANPDCELPHSHLALVNRAVRQVRGTSRQSVPIVQLLGADPTSKQTIAWHIANALGFTLYRMSVSVIPDNPVDLEQLARLWHRESMLLPIALYLDALEVDDLSQVVQSRLERIITRSGGRFFLDLRDGQHSPNWVTIDLEVAKPTAAEQQETWKTALNKWTGLDEGIAQRLANQFHLNISTIHEIAQTLTDQVQGEVSEDDLWDTCLAFTRPRMDTLAQRIDPKFTWDDIVLPQHAVEVLRQIADQVRYRGKVYEDWGMRQRLSRGLGMVVLFSGESGTGKTMGAEVIANELKLSLYRIDLSAVVSKYIGETEKNLRHLFDAAEDGGSILFFDEADALFGKRSQVKDSHDRYANIETNYLLQRIEAYHGLAILATNMKSGLDEAFTRRLRFTIEFPFPDESSRKNIWRKSFPREMPVGNLDYDRLSKFNLAGGSIFNIVINAAFLAARDDTPVLMAHVMNAIRNELRKSDRLVDEREFMHH